MQEGLALLLSPPLGWVVTTVFGALWGSFFNVAIYRLGQEEARLRDLVRPPSHCPRCKTPIRARDNVPLFGWLLLRGRCRACGAPISIRYPLVEFAGAAIGAAVYAKFIAGGGEPPARALARFLVEFLFVGTLFVLAAIDLETMLLPEAITLPSIPLFFLLGRFLGDVPLADAAIGALVGFGGLKAIEWGYRRATGREGMGGGDAMLMAIIGGFLGWKALPFTMGLGAVFGTLVTVPLLLVARRRQRRDAVMHKGDVAVQQHDVAMQQAATGPGDVAAQQNDSAMQQENVA